MAVEAVNLRCDRVEDGLLPDDLAADAVETGEDAGFLLVGVVFEAPGDEDAVAPDAGGAVAAGERSFPEEVLGRSELGGRRFAVVVHLLSIAHNWRVRLRTFCPDGGFPLVESLLGVWPSANWYEREAFDLFGIVFDGHPDLRRILTDYGFIGHPFRKDFPLSGYVEMRYDPEQKRVIYQPVSIEPREIVPRIVREEHYAEGQ